MTLKGGPQRGLGIVTIVIVGVILALVLGVWLARGSSNAIDVNDQKAALLASEVSQDGAQLRAIVQNGALDRIPTEDMRLRFEGAPSGEFDLFALGYGYGPDVSADAIDPAYTGPQSWLLGNVPVPGVGGTGLDWVVFVPGLRYAVCAVLNEQIHGDDASALDRSAYTTDILTAAPLSDWVNDGDDDGRIDAALPSNTFSATRIPGTVTNWTGRERGCVATSDSVYLYYAVVDRR